MIPAPQDGANAPLPAAETRLNGADLDRLRRSLDSSVSDNTRAMYNSAWHGFKSWAQARGARSLPTSSPLVAAYLAHMAEERRLSVATVLPASGTCGGSAHSDSDPAGHRKGRFHRHPEVRLTHSTNSSTTASGNLTR